MKSSYSTGGLNKCFLKSSENVPNVVGGRCKDSPVVSSRTGRLFRPIAATSTGRYPLQGQAGSRRKDRPVAATRTGR